MAPWGTLGSSHPVGSSLGSSLKFKVLLRLEPRWPSGSKMCGRTLGSPEYASYDLRASKHYPAGLLWQSLWQGCCPIQNLGRWVCSSVSGKVERNQSCFQKESACLGKMSHHFCEILIHQYSPWEGCFTKKFTSNCWKGSEIWVPNCYEGFENFT